MGIYRRHRHPAICDGLYMLLSTCWIKTWGIYACSRDYVGLWRRLYSFSNSWSLLSHYFFLFMKTFNEYVFSLTLHLSINKFIYTNLIFFKQQLSIVTSTHFNLWRKKKYMHSLLSSCMCTILGKAWFRCYFRKTGSWQTIQ